MFCKKNPKVPRLVEKNGECLVVSNIPLKERIFGYIGDSFTGYVDMSWRFHFLIFFGAFFFAWNVTGLIWVLTVPKPGDSITESSCIKEASNPIQAILFSYETQSTVGYGYRYMISECNVGGYILHFLQIFIGVLLPTLLGGIMFLKSRRPIKRYETIMFSKIATIFDESFIEKVDDSAGPKNSKGRFKRDQTYLRRTRRLFQFRVGNLRHSHLVSSSIRTILVKDRQTDEGEVIPFCMHQLPICTITVGTEEASENPGLAFLTWPVLVTHEIKDDSPMTDIGNLGLNYEIIVLLEGIIEPTGKPTQLRTSYKPDEIRWQHKFAPIVMEFKSSRGERDFKDIISVDYSSFDITIPLHRTFSREEIVTKSEIPAKFSYHS